MNPDLATLADQAPVGHVPLADPDFMLLAQPGPDKLPEDVILRLSAPVPLACFTAILNEACKIAKLAGREARMLSRANYIEVFTVPAPCKPSKPSKRQK